MTEIIAAIIGIISTIIVSVFTYFMARRAGIGPYQDTIVAKLKDLVELQEKEIDTLKKDKDSLVTRVTDLERKVEELEDLTVRQALVIDRLNLAKTTQRTRTRGKPQQSQISSQEGGN